jgi:hypothetical protein
LLRAQLCHSGMNVRVKIYGGAHDAEHSAS